MTDFATHFNHDAWQSFVCGILPASKKQAMQSHLDRGCAECQRSYETWRQFLETTSHDLSAFLAGLALLARSVFDSFLGPSPIGLRGSATAQRQLVYEAGGYLIDLQLEQGAGGPGVLAGQVVHAWIDGATRGAVVLLVREDTVVDQTVANSIGEFQLDCDYGDNLKICLRTPDETFIEVVLPDARSAPEPAIGWKQPIVITNNNGKQ